MHATKVRLWVVPWEEVTVLNGQQRRSVRKFLGIQDEEEEPGGETKKAEPEKVLRKPASRGRLKPPRPDAKKKVSKGVEKEKGKKDKKESAKEGKKKRGKDPREGEAVPSVS